jgi:hypothetical protein
METKKDLNFARLPVDKFVNKSGAVAEKKRQWKKFFGAILWLTK